MREDIRFFTFTGSDAPFSVDMAGISYCDGTYMISRECSEIYVFEYILKGKGTVVVDSVEYTAREGDVYILRKGTSHRYFSDAEDPWIKVFFNVRGDLVGSLLSAYGINEVVLEGRKLKDMFMAVYDFTHSDLGLNDITERCTMMLHRILYNIYADKQKKPMNSDEALRLKLYIDSHMSENITVEALSAMIYRSKDYTIKLFKREFGQTPYAYLLSKRMEAASYLLKNTSSAVKSIAMNLGYEDQHYFSNVFKKEFGVSPKVFREENKKTTFR